MITQKVGNRIRELRTKTGLSQEKFAAKIENKENSAVTKSRDDASHYADRFIQLKKIALNQQ